MLCFKTIFFYFTEVTHRFSHCCGKNIQITSNGCTASRTQNFNHGLIFSSDPLKRDEIFEIKIEKLSKQWSGSLRIGLTSMAISDTTPASSVPLSSLDLTSKLTWVVTGSEVKKSGVTIKENYCPSLERLEVSLYQFCVVQGLIHVQRDKTMIKMASMQSVDQYCLGPSHSKFNEFVS